MPNSLIAIFFILVGYLLGSISFAVIVSKCMRLADPHTYGSGNPGATNVFRTGNKIAALLTLLGDVAKGYLAVLFTLYFAPICGIDIHNGLVELVGFAAFIGHLAPLFHKFVGGKGVATLFGILFGLNWILGMAALLTWGLIAYFFRYSSLAALITAIFVPIYHIFLFGLHFSSGIIALMSLLLIYRHRQNIHRLRLGKEKRF